MIIAEETCPKLWTFIEMVQTLIALVCKNSMIRMSFELEKQEITLDMTCTPAMNRASFFLGAICKFLSLHTLMLRIIYNLK